MHIIAKDGTRLHVREDGVLNGPPLVFANSLGTDLRLWDEIVPHFPNHRVIRYDKRGHGQSDVPDPPYAMGMLITDVETILDDLGVTGATFVGLSIGGMIAQGLAVKRPDLIARLVLSNTAARIGTDDLWSKRIETAMHEGMEPLADGVMERWFGRDFRAGPELATWRERLVNTPVGGYAGCCAAIRGTDLYTPTSGLRLPTLAIAGSEDGATPPDLVRETADLIPGSRFALIRRVGHLPCVEAPEEYARILSDFL
ncbi:3-oxoadipate enol-lactonase 2 [Jannaschia seosinensis]|uniref:3-oxoadipate enol-lactonase 2 n=1 Tax=Jannaschia seosinensis TaxID=313367 RepID=A0A0M7B655_9RHOB|nr:3-oxoadipate enol-lactonase [Jannaschia seosinensis]CUH16889.1 3-oxoadipate enol-lactonase 2 [Jannaschia seosinensis]